MEDIIIKKEFWDKIISGKKNYEFRKLSKGLTTATYRFITKEVKSWCEDCEIKKMAQNCIARRCNNCNQTCLIIPVQIFGTATLTPIFVSGTPNIKLGYGYCSYNFIKTNQDLNIYQPTLLGKPYGIPVDVSWTFYHEGYYDDELFSIDKETYKFVKESYIDKNIDYIAYEITNAK